MKEAENTPGNPRHFSSGDKMAAKRRIRRKTERIADILPLSTKPQSSDG
jgi:hypothetical protein